MSNRPYIGITGITSAADCVVAAECVKLVPPSHRFMGGVLASAKTLLGEATANRRYPEFRRVNDLLRSLAAVGAWPVVHFNCCEELPFHLGALAAALPAMRGLQINVEAWPDPRLLAHFRCLRPDVEVILQYRPASHGRDHGSVVRAAAAYEGVAEFVLIDGSMGGGVPLGAADALWFASLARNHLLLDARVRVALAGGFGPGAGAVLRGLRQEAGPGLVSRLSLDAESGVRSPMADAIPGEKGQDEIDEGKALAWVRLAAEVLS